MTYLISRANYERCTEGMSDAERAEFDRDFQRYPDRISPDGRIDLERVADEYARLRARETGMPAELVSRSVTGRGLPAIPWLLDEVDQAPYATTAWHCPKGNGKSAVRPPDPWVELGDGVYVAPTGTPMFTPDPGPAPTIEDLAEQVFPWTQPHLNVDEFVNDFRASEPDRDRRFYLNNLVGEDKRPAGPDTRMVQVNDPLASPIEDILGWWRRFAPRPAPRPQRLAAGELALAMFQLAARPAKVRGYDQVMVELTGVPIVADPDLPGHVWQLVDADTKEILHEGAISPALAALAREYLDHAREAVETLADRADLPRDLL